MSRAETLRLAREYPRDTILEFRDEDGKSRLGQVVGHAHGALSVVSPPDASTRRQRLGLTAKTYEMVQKRRQVRAVDVLEVRKGEGRKPGECPQCGHDLRDRAHDQKKLGKRTLICPQCGRSFRLTTLFPVKGATA